MKPNTIAMMAKVDETYQLGQRETICLGLLAQHEHMTARQLADALMLQDVQDIRAWLGRLQDLRLVEMQGRTKAAQYFIAPELVDRLQLPQSTTLARIEPHRLEALVLEDIRRYSDSAFGDIHDRIGPEIPRSRLKRVIDGLVTDGRVTYTGDRRWRRYRLAS